MTALTIDERSRLVDMEWAAIKYVDDLPVLSLVALGLAVHLGFGMYEITKAGLAALIVPIPR